MTDVIIIGGGIAGLTAGIYCLKQGLSCELIEKNTECGGNLTGWSREGCYIDNCTHWLTGTHPHSSLYGIWKNIGMITEENDALYQGDIFYESEFKDQRITFFRDTESTRFNMLLSFPEDKKEINAFMNAVEAVAEYMKTGYISPNLLNGCIRYKRISLTELGMRFSSPLMNKAYSDYILGDFSAIFLIWSYAAFVCGNGMIPRGGSLNAAKRIANIYTELGGTLHTASCVERIVTENKQAKGVILDNGEYICGKAVICACDPCITFGKLLENKYIPRAYLARKKDLELRKKFSSVHGAFVCDSASLEKFGTRVIDCEISPNGRLILREYGYEPSFAPQGKTVIQTMIYQDEYISNDWINAYKTDREKYETQKEKYKIAMENAVKRSLPQISQSLKCIDVWTPATYNKYFDSECGSYMGFMLMPKSSLHSFSGKLKELKNVFIASQWQCSPGGLPNAARAGKKAAMLVKKLNNY